MTNTNRLIINTLAQNLRTILNIAMSLYSTRLVLEALGKSEYGIYMLVGGIVSLLSYVTNSMIITTQRHLSYNYGTGDSRQAKLIFQNSYLLHCVIGTVISAAFFSLTPFLFDNHFLNIDTSQLEEAKYVYYFVILSVLLTFIASPFRATLIAHENIVYISVVDVLDGVLKLGLVFLLFYIDSYKLTLYSAIMAFVMFFNLAALASYSKFHYCECCLLPNIKAFDKAVQKKLIGFATWTLYGTMCIFLRAQGIAVVLNKLLGIIVNTAYGIANQVFGSIQFLSQAILNAITPQIIKAEGAHDRERMICLSLYACKYCFLLLSIVAVPFIFEMESVLRLWLGDIPEYTVVLCRMLLIASLADQLTIGLNASIQAIGNIRNYTLLLYTIKVITVPIFWIVIKSGLTIDLGIMIYILLEFAAAIVRFFYLVKTTTLSVGCFFNTVLFRVALPCMAMMTVCYMMCLLPDFLFRFLVTGVVSAILGIVVAWYSGLDGVEQTYLINIIKRRKENQK